MNAYARAVGLILTFAAVPAHAQTAVEQPRGVSVGTEMVASSRYIWRGLEEGGFSLQPSSWIAFGGLRATSWFNFTSLPTEHPTFTEQNVTVAYTRELGSYAVTGGWTGYFFPSTNGQSHEAVVSVARAGLLSPTLSVYSDFGLGHGTYVSAAIRHPLPDLVPRVTLTPTLSIGYNHHHWIGGSGLSDANVGLTATWNASRHLSVGPFLNHSRSLNAARVPTRTYGGISVSVR